MSYTYAIGQVAVVPESICAAKILQAAERQDLAVQVLAGTQPVTVLARENGVSRKFLYAQVDKAQQALAEIFAAEEKDAQVLYTLPVTKQWLKQLVLALTLINHSSLRGVVELLRDLFDLPFSLGTVHNIVAQAVPLVRKLHQDEDLAGIRVGAHDEIFQAGQPVLAGVDTRSTYCYLLALAEARDETTWGVHLLDLQAKGLRPQATVADFGRGLRAGQAAAWPATPCFGDVFHSLYELNAVCSYLENRALGAMAAAAKLAAQLERSREKDDQLATRLTTARQEEAQALALADALAVLTHWLRQDILAVVGPDLKTRQALFDWVVEELRLREDKAPHRITPIRRKLENHRDELLGFVAVLEKNLAGLAQEFQVSLATVWEVYQLAGVAADEPERYPREQALWLQLGERFHFLRQAVKELLAQSVRASSLVENLNSRLRSYFFLRRELGPAYLELLRFFLNHRRFMRSERSERAGRSPAESEHAHWLELLGFQLFKRAA